MNAAIKPLLSKQEAAALLGVSTRTVDRWVQVYDLGEVRLTKTSNPRFRRATIEAGFFSKKVKRK